MEAVRVFVSNAAGHDYKAAERYGELIFVIKGYISFQSLDRVKYTIAKRIETATADDWLCISGTSVINVIAALIWFRRFGIVKLLVWDKKYENQNGGRYRELIITRENIDNVLEQL